MLSIQSPNAAFVASQLEAGVSALPAASAAAGKATGLVVLKETTRALEEEIYEAPLPDSYAFFGRTERTGALLAGEALVQIAPSEHLITTVNTGFGGQDPTQYAAARHANTKFYAPWRTDGLDEAEPQIPKVSETALLQAMPDGLVTP